MKPPPLRLCGLVLFFALLTPARGQFSSAKISKIDIKHIGPASVSDEYIRANIRVKVGDKYLRAGIDDDEQNLYATGLIYNIRVAPPEVTPIGVVPCYVVEGKPRLTSIHLRVN